MTPRVLLIGAGAAVLLIVILTATVTALVVSGAGGGSAGEGAGGEGQAGLNPEPEQPADANGYWNFTISMDDQRYEMPEDEISFTVDIYQAEDGYLAGDGFAEYQGEDYEVSVGEGTASYVRPDGDMSIVLDGAGDGSETGVYDGNFDFLLEGQLSGDTLEGEIEGEMFYYVESDVQAIGAATDFTAEKQ